MAEKAVTGKMGAGDIEEVVKLHKANLDEGMMPALGKPIMRLFYSHILSDPKSFCYVVRDNSKIVGAAISTTDYQNLLKKFYRHNFFSLLKSLSFFLIRRPIRIIDIIKLASQEKGEKECLVFIFIDKAMRGRRLGTKLFGLVSKEFKRRNAAKFTIEVNSGNPANNFYIKNKCALASSYKFFGKERNVYVAKI